ncbi:MAG: glucosyltransferase domain-containing protein [Lachnospiraceae bacterium]|nr:glucosyltransferase domain-containing protein [Lachnospiraceae bacterium]
MNELKQFRKDFLFNFFIEFFLYFPFLTGWLTNGDGTTHSLFHKKAYTWEAMNGRFGIRLTDTLFRSRIIMPYLSTLLTLIFLDLMILLILRLFRVEKKLYRILISLILIASPTISNQMTYYYCSDSYMFSYLLSVLGLLILAEGAGFTVLGYRIFRMRFGSGIAFLCATLCFTISLSLYQAPLIMSVTAALLYFLGFAVTNEESFMGGRFSKDFRCRFLRMLFGGIAGVLIYILAFFLIRRFTGIEVTKAHGFNDVFSFSAQEGGGLLSRIGGAYRDTFRYFLTNDIIRNSWRRRGMVNAAIMIFTVALTVFRLRQHTPVMLLRWITAIVLLLLLPFTMGIVTVIAPGAPLTGETGLLTVMQMNFLYVYLLILAMNGGKKESREYHVLRAVSVLLSVMLVWILFTYTFAFMHVLRLNHSRAMGVGARIVDAVEESGEYEDGMRLMVGGVMEKGKYPFPDKELLDIVQGSVAAYSMFWDGGVHSEGWAGFLKAEFGMDYDYVRSDEHNAILEDPEYQAMSIFPEDGSVKKIGDVLVIKLSR